jgi:FtsP/CotA-like multicopper oxidase with cupredoxin domain
MRENAALRNRYRDQTAETSPARRPLGRAFGLRFWASASTATLILLQTLPADAQRRREARPLATPPTQFIDCPLPGQPLIRIPELVSQGGLLRGTIVLRDLPQRLDLGLGPDKCVPQFVRAFRGVRAVLPEYPGAIPPGYQGAVPTPPLVPFQDPVPGPTLRARVGDIVQLTFLNHIDTGNFGDSIDRGERNERGKGCDESSLPYPGPDTHPNCFHGSSTGNIHFHGTHTTPSTTGDNIFIEVRPSPRKNGQPTVTEASVRESFDKFFAECGLRLANDPLLQWPRTWSDLPAAWVAEQENLLRQYDSDPTIKSKLWPVNAKQWAEGAWPQYYIGAFPFCFRLPEFPTKAASRSGQSHAGHGAAMHTAVEQQTAVAGTRSPQMGQAPGTHWYHAHKHGSTAINVMNGMTGAFVIEGGYDDALNKFYGSGSAEQPLWTRQQPVLVINELGVSPKLVGGGNTLPFSVNGRWKPKLTMRPGEVQLWRIVNTSSRSGVAMAGFSANDVPDPKFADFSWKQIAQDGVQFSEANYDVSKEREFLMMSGNRADILVKAPLNESGQAQVFNLIVRNAINAVEARDNTPQILLSVEVAAGPIVSGNQSVFISGPDYPAFPEFLADISAGQVKATKRIVFNSETPRPKGTPPFTMHTIDGNKFDGSIGQVVLLNSVEEWKIENATVAGEIDKEQVIDHPFHIHINPFQVVEVFDPNEMVTIGNDNVAKFAFSKDAPFDPAKQCYLDPFKPDTWKDCHPTVPRNIWWDVFPIPGGLAARKSDGTAIVDANGKQVVVPGYFKMRSRFVDYAGQYVIHCHILAHEDRGMMTIVQVTPRTTPYSHQ